MAAESHRLEDAARIAMGGFDESYAIILPAGHSALSPWYLRAGYAAGFASLCAIVILAVT